MKQKKNEGDALFRAYGYWGLGFGILGIICLLSLGINGALLLVNSSVNKPVYWALFFVCLLLLVASIAFSFWFFAKRSKMKLEQLSASSYFLESTFVYSEGAFLRETKRLSNEGSKKCTGYVAVLNVKGINGDILTFYGPEEAKAINSIVFSCLYERFHQRREFRYGFSLVNSFLIFYRGENEDMLDGELMALAHDIEDKVIARGKISTITILFGTSSIKNEKNCQDALDHATFASRYNASNRFSSGVIPFSKDQMDFSENEKELPSDILRAIREEQFQIFYQPKFNLRTQKFYGAEALVRWSHPTRGLLPPSFFIPFSEKSGLIVDLDHYIYEHTMRDISRWEANDEPLVRMSINLSRRTVYNEGLVNFLQDTAKRYGVDSKWIDIEITESLAARDAAFLYQLVSKIKNLGMATSIDDFGVGYSSFNSLKKLPFDTLKIDKSFIDDIEVDTKSRDIVRAVIDLAHSMGMWTIAEGVETAKQVEILSSMGLDAVQGYYYSRPLNGFEFQRFLKNNPFEKKDAKGAKK